MLTRSYAFFPSLFTLSSTKESTKPEEHKSSLPEFHQRVKVLGEEQAWVIQQIIVMDQIHDPS